MTVELGKKPSCINHPHGTLSIIIITLGYFKYLIVVLGILYYCICQRLTRQLIHFQEIETNNQETEDFLIKYVNDMAQNESCSICMENNKRLILVDILIHHSSNKIIILRLLIHSFFIDTAFDLSNLSPEFLHDIIHDMLSAKVD